MGLLDIANPGRPSAMQLRAFRWRQADGQDILEPTDDLILNPPMFPLANGGRQLVRVGLRGTPPAEREGAYRLLIDQIPEAESEADGLSLPIRLSVPVFVAASLPPARLAWRLAPGGGALTVTNCGGRHARIDSLTLTRGEVQRLRGGPIYLLAGTSRPLPLEAAMRPDGVRPLHVSASTEEGVVEAELGAPSGDAGRTGSDRPCG